MTILLTGYKGFVGQHLWTRLLSLGHQVTVMGRRDLLPTTRFDAVINCAGEINDSSKMYESNVAFVARLLDWAREAEIPKLIHIGSSAEYGKTDAPRAENLVCVPSNIYEATKLAGTALCQGYASQYDLNVCVSRPFSLYGPNDTPRKLIPTLFRSFLSHEPISIHAEASHDWLYIDDFIDGLILLLNLPREKTKGQIVNFGTGHESNNAEVVKAMEAALGSQFYIVKQETKFHDYDTHNWVADISKAKALGWSPKHDLYTGLKAYVMAEWFKNPKP